ncbi:MAG: tetratricopeptide repeat protein [Planctomycetia bacterium]|nr:tetratricopeptide repeat protein [Planctomycetia bacterium]
MQSHTGFALAAMGSILLAAGCHRSSPEQPAEPTPAVTSGVTADANARPEFVGSKTCRDCHADFYKLWSTSHHGLAMQPYTAEFARANLAPQTDDIVIAGARYRAEIGEAGCVRQTGPDGEKKYPIAHVMGGKNVYYLLTTLHRGRLQVLPVAYDVQKKTWYDTAASGVRHFPDRRDEALHWTDRMFTFNTICFNCHVSQLRTNYDLASDTYNTTWSEPGISCESCHGPAGEHLRVMLSAPKPDKIDDIKIIRAKDFTTAQMNDMCATCHAKLVPLSLDFRPGDKFFDHFDLIVLDHPDFYPDGRDLGENYTCTTWMMSPCAASGKLDCNHCHTPSGRMRYSGAEANKSCAPCHQQYVDNPAPHGHHAVGSQGNECVGCHMPMTRFAAMNRSDHSMLPPVPAATLALKSPNACNLCHADKDAAWADSWVRKWYPRDYQASVIDRASLVDAARKDDWKRLPEVLERIADPKENAVYKASLARLLHNCEDASKWPALRKALEDASPLVRASAAASLANYLDAESLAALVAATRDPSRLVRIRAALALAPLPPEQLADPEDRESLRRAVDEFKTAMKARPDDWAGYANLGTFHMQSRDFAAAVDCFETAARLEPRMVGPLVNASIAYSNLGLSDKAESSLRRALEADPKNAAALFNLGLLLAEENRPKEAEESLRAALASDPKMAAAAHNLGTLIGTRDVAEAIAWCRKAREIEPENPKYAHTLAFFLRSKGEAAEAVEILRKFVERRTPSVEIYLLLAAIYEDRGARPAALAVYQRALALPGLSPPVRGQLETKTRSLKPSEPDR